MDMSRCESPRVLSMGQRGMEMLGFSGAWQNWREASVIFGWQPSACQGSIAGGVVLRASWRGHA